MNESVDLVDSGNDLVVIILSLVGARTVLDFEYRYYDKSIGTA